MFTILLLSVAMYPGGLTPINCSFSTFCNVFWTGYSVFSFYSHLIVKKTQSKWLQDQEEAREIKEKQRKRRRRKKVRIPTYFFLKKNQNIRFKALLLIFFWVILLETFIYLFIFEFCSCAQCSWHYCHHPLWITSHTQGIWCFFFFVFVFVFNPPSRKRKTNWLCDKCVSSCRASQLIESSMWESF